MPAMTGNYNNKYMWSSSTQELSDYRCISLHTMITLILICYGILIHISSYVIEQQCAVLNVIDINSTYIGMLWKYCCNYHECWYFKASHCVICYCPSHYSYMLFFKRFLLPWSSFSHSSYINNIFFTICMPSITHICTCTLYIHACCTYIHARCLINTFSNAWAILNNIAD